MGFFICLIALLPSVLSGNVAEIIQLPMGALRTCKDRMLNDVWKPLTTLTIPSELLKSQPRNQAISSLVFKLDPIYIARFQLRPGNARQTIEIFDNCVGMTASFMAQNQTSNASHYVHLRLDHIVTVATIAITSDETQTWSVTVNVQVTIPTEAARLRGLPAPQEQGEVSDLLRWLCDLVRFAFARRLEASYSSAVKNQLNFPASSPVTSDINVTRRVVDWSYDSGDMLTLQLSTAVYEITKQPIFGTAHETISLDPLAIEQVQSGASMQLVEEMLKLACSLNWLSWTYPDNSLACFFCANGLAFDSSSRYLKGRCQVDKKSPFAVTLTLTAAGYDTSNRLQLKIESLQQDSTDPKLSRKISRLADNALYYTAIPVLAIPGVSFSSPLVTLNTNTLRFSAAPIITNK